MMLILYYLMGLITCCDGCEMFSPNNLCEENRQLLKSVTNRQRKKFIDRKIVPLPVLEVLWDMDFLPGNRPPRKGMRVYVLLEYLKKTGCFQDKNYDYRDVKNRILGTLLHNTIEPEEFPGPEFSDEKFVKSGGEFMPISYLRTIPGTIFR